MPSQLNLSMTKDVIRKARTKSAYNYLKLYFFLQIIRGVIFLSFYLWQAYSSEDNLNENEYEESNDASVEE